MNVGLSAITGHRHVPLISLLSANAISQLGSMFMFIALPWFVLQTTGSASKAGITVAVDGFPLLLTGIFGGVLLDRFGYKPSSVVADLLSASMMAAIPILYETAGISFWQLLVLVFLGSLVAQAGKTAQTSLIPELALISETSLERANSLAQSTRRAALLFGPPLAGLLVAGAGATGALWIDAFSYVISAMTVALGVPPMPSTFEQTHQSGFGDVVEGIRYLINDRLLLTIASGASIALFISEPIYGIVYPVYSRQVFHSVVTLGLMYSSLAAGSLAGLAVFSVCGSRLPRREVLLVGMTAQSTSFWVLLIHPSLPVLMASIALGAMCFEPINPLVSSLVQERAPAAIRGRVIGSFNAIAIGSVPFGTMAGGFLLSGQGLSSTIFVISSATTLLVVGLFTVLAVKSNVNQSLRSRLDRV